MKWISVCFMVMVPVLSWSEEMRLVRGTLNGVDSVAKALNMNGRSISYPLIQNVVVESKSVESEHYLLLPGLDVSLYSDDGKNVSRIFIHGPYSLLKKAAMD